MNKVAGKSVQNGIAIGKIKVYRKADDLVERFTVSDPQKEKDRLNEAISFAMNQLQDLYDTVEKSAGEDNAAIFEFHQMMLQDDDYLESMENIIESENVNAEYAVARTSDIFSEMFSSLEDEYMRARSVDVKDVSARLIRILSGKDGNNFSKLNERVIILAEDLSPSETIQMDKSMIQAFVTVHGSLTSHTAILARTMNIPALISVDLDNLEQYDGMAAIVDGGESVFIIEPEDSQIDEYFEKQNAELEKQKLLLDLKGKRTVTSSGKEIHLYANVGNVGDIAFAQENDAEGIGLFRSEFIYLGANDYPSEEEQFQIYKQALQLMGKKKLIIRTCDIGADKQIDYFNLEKEENPALGYRAIRICLDRIDFFKTQLRALFRAGVYGNLSIMFPMIISVDEVLEIKKLVLSVQNELETQGIPYAKNIEQGVMIETPAAALISDQLAKEVDFFSIGTNDLTQYTLAMDRQNSKLENRYDKHHPAIMTLIKMTIDNAHANNIWVGICGELGSDLDLTDRFIEMGIDELSVSPSMVLKLRKKILDC